MIANRRSILNLRRPDCKNVYEPDTALTIESPPPHNLRRALPIRARQRLEAMMKTDISTFGYPIGTTDARTADSGQVRLGGTAPSLPRRSTEAAVADTGKVRFGGTSPSFPVQRPTGAVADGAKVRMGGTAPSFPR